MASRHSVVKGDRRLRLTLKRAGVDMKQFRAVNMEAAQTVSKAAVPLTPRLNNVLVKTVRAAATQKSGIVRAGFKAVPYAGVIHWGWRARGIKSQPFLHQAAKETEPVWVEEYSQHVLKILSEIKGV